ncbi:DUF4861 family protein [Actomonas aquatica]|uniref:DUF4861 family protein n=1 Tax=Actomonas aquatica TaxID=2866162 RepID=A0ABZ1C7E4_9BACT|nr:DUF4861 family protein [Opitutus sp. WL0086]WRQ87305.1 DUF4861 family protein [Opitutus sp. WL0086]
MFRFRPLALLLAAFLAVPLSAEHFRVTVSRDDSAARPDAIISVPFAAVRERLPDVRFDHVQVRRADTGALLPFQITNFTPNIRPARYDDLLWHYDFAAGETSATFLIETTDAVVPPFPSRVFARHVPERLDDFAWENDRMGHRAYGPRLNTPEAGKSQLRSAGLDYWAKRVPYLIVDRWYLKGHDAYHVDSGEGLDMYSVGTNAGVGGTAAWLEGAAHSAGNWQAARVLANGPLRAVFELDYAPIELGEGATLTETKRFIVDAGRNLDRIESRFTLTGADSAVVAFGLTRRDEMNPEVQSVADAAGFISNWSVYPDDHGALGTAVVLAPGTTVAGSARDDANDYLLVTVADGSVVTYYAGGGWSLSGHFPSHDAWKVYLTQFFSRLTSPLTLTFDPAQ